MRVAFDTKHAKDDMKDWKNPANVGVGLQGSGFLSSKSMVQGALELARGWGL